MVDNLNDFVDKLSYWGGAIITIKELASMVITIIKKVKKSKKLQKLLHRIARR